jgi:energy-coupling factor transport system ATP-binding protein
MIKIEGLAFRYDGAPGNALSDVSLEIREGDFIGIIGPSGAGKSTLTYVLNGIVPCRYNGDFCGRVEIRGMDAVKAGPEILSRYVGSVFQDIEGQILSSVVEDEILFGLENFGIPRGEIESRIERALETAGISGLRHRNISDLSGGQKQKVAIASIIALRPEIMVLDEPTGELDPQSSRGVFETLKELNERHGVTIVIVEQKIMLLCEFAGRMAVMSGGRVAVEGAVRDVLRRGELLEDAGVNIPRVTTLARELRGRGLYGGPAPVNLTEAEKMMREAVRDAEI